MRKLLVQIGDLVGQFGLTIILFVVSMGCTVPQSFAGAENRLFSPAVDSRGKVDEAMKSRIIRYRFVNVDLRPLLASEEPLRNSTATRAVVVLNLFEDTVLRAVLDRRETRSAASFTWFGHIDGIENSQVTLVVEDGVMSGNVRLDHSFYQIRYAGDGTHVIYQVDPNAFPRDSKPVSPRGQK